MSFQEHFESFQTVKNKKLFKWIFLQTSDANEIFSRKLEPSNFFWPDESSLPAEIPQNLSIFN